MKPTKIQIAKALRACAEKHKWGRTDLCPLCLLFKENCVECKKKALDISGKIPSGEWRNTCCHCCDWKPNGYKGQLDASNYWSDSYHATDRSVFRRAANRALRKAADKLERESR